MPPRSSSRRKCVRSSSSAASRVMGRRARRADCALIRAKLERKGMTPAPPAGKRELMRRVTFDLTGLPPTPEEVAVYMADRSPNAYEKLVDRLLASPHYGERWARYWLDLVRYADSNG